VDERLLKTPLIALMQVKKEVKYMSAIAYENIEKSTKVLCGENGDFGKEIMSGEEMIDFTNKALTKYLIRLSPLVGERDEKVIGSYFHVLNDLERIGDHAENFLEISTQMKDEGVEFSNGARAELREMSNKVLQMYEIASEAFNDKKRARLKELTRLESEVDDMKRKLSANHFTRLADGVCRVEVSAYFFSAVAGLERVADHLINVGYSILNPIGSQSETEKQGKTVSGLKRTPKLKNKNLS
jgi:phosphate:Na+ symporter